MGGSSAETLLPVNLDSNEGRGRGGAEMGVSYLHKVTILYF